ncbi:uncharacterized protein [Miscanthus floridulus]|uniref:uncharacterized protein n=1 Tax=Miscanthus floridulus TaxID=154761 RepID=UPI003459FDCA
MAANCVHGGLAYIGVSMGGTDHGAITPTPRKTERACVGNAIELPLRMRWEDRARAPMFGNQREQRGQGVNAASLHGELKGRDQSKDGVSLWGLLENPFPHHTYADGSVAPAVAAAGALDKPMPGQVRRPLPNGMSCICLARTRAVEPVLRELWEESRDLLGHPSPSLGDTAAAAVPRVDLPSTPLAFLHDHVSPGRPLLVSAAATRHWPAASLWPTASYLTDALCSTAVSLHLTPDGHADALASHPHPRRLGPSRFFASAHVHRVDFPTAVRLIRGSDPATGLVAYAQQQDDCLRGEYTAIAGDVDAHVPWANEVLGCLPEAVNL